MLFLKHRGWGGGVGGLPSLFSSLRGSSPPGLAGTGASGFSAVGEPIPDVSLHQCLPDVVVVGTRPTWQSAGCLRKLSPSKNNYSRLSGFPGGASVCPLVGPLALFRAFSGPVDSLWSAWQLRSRGAEAFVKGVLLTKDVSFSHFGSQFMILEGS